MTYPRTRTLMGIRTLIRIRARHRRVMPGVLTALLPAALAGGCAAPLERAPSVSGDANPIATGAAVPGMEPAVWNALLAAEDARLAGPEQLDRVRRALGSSNPHARVMAVRALGRTERAELTPLIVPLLDDADAGVRAAAAHALGDVTRGPDGSVARAALLAALERGDAEAAVTAARAETIGRLRSDAAAASAVTARLLPLLAREDAARTGALLGLYFLARQPDARPAVAAAVGELARTARGAAGTDAVLTRVLALATLSILRAPDEGTLTAALGADAAAVRREAAAATAAVGDTAAVRRLTGIALRDPAPAVRYEGVRVRAARLAASGGCSAVTDAVHDGDAHVSLLAIDLLGTTCRSAAAGSLLDSIAAGPIPADRWHRSAHAAVALAAVDPGRAAPHVRALATHPVQFARAWAARGAALTGDTMVLRRLAGDASANVRTAAIGALARVAGRAGDAVYAAQLSSDESELLMAAAAALEGTPQSVAPQLVDALERVGALRRETSRDARLALLERLQELGDAALASRIRPLLVDFDSVVARRAAEVLTAWTGTAHRATPRPLPPQPLPTYAEALELTRREHVLEMADGGRIVIQLLPFAAPTNAARFARLARSGYFDGLTIHRVAPNFVVQGGSPGANEYSGAGPFTRDELGVSNRRGTVGLSTRGRDTGDAQFYINLIDNIRLDHEYTVFGVVTSGMDVVDRLLEGAVIRRITERPRD